MTVQRPKLVSAWDGDVDGAGGEGEGPGGGDAAKVGFDLMWVGGWRGLGGVSLGR